MKLDAFPPFEPHPLLWNGHLQTLGALLFARSRSRGSGRQHWVALEDGDQIVLHDDRPRGWHAGDRTALLIHGLAGCHQSAYMERIATKLNQRGVRTFRMDLRGCGAGARLARYPYHSGRSEDAGAALAYIARVCPDSPTTLVGFSLGGNIALKLLGELGGEGMGNLDNAIAVSPPADLAACVAAIRRPANRLYEQQFVALLVRLVRQRRGLVPDAPTVEFTRWPRSLPEFDDVFTGPVCGFGTAENYYRRCSSAPLVSRIRIPTVILAARDDPMVPAEVLEGLRLSSSVRLRLTRHGGHLGYVGRRRADGDRRWMDWRVVDWVTGARSD